MCKYASPSSGEIVVVDDSSLHKAIKDAEFRGTHFLELKISSSSSSQPRSSYGASGGSASSSPARPAASPSYQQHSSPQSRATAPASASPSRPAASAASGSSGGTLANFSVQADRSSSSDKLVVKANQETDHFAFVCQPSKFPSEVTVHLEGVKLVYDSTTTSPDGRITKFTQAFNLPFSPNPDRIEVVSSGAQGHILRMYFA